MPIKGRGRPLPSFATTLSHPRSTKLSDSPTSKVKATRLRPSFTVPPPCMRPGIGRVTVTLKCAEPRLPTASIAVHSTAVVPIGNVLPDAGTHETPIVALTASLAEAANVITRPSAELASSLMSAGTVTNGAVVSRTVTLNADSAGLPAASSAEQTTFVVPSANRLPDAGRHETATAPLTVSVADVSNVTTRPPGEVASSTMFAGTVSTGAVVS